MMKTRTAERTVRTTVTYTLTGEDLRKLLNLPETTKVTFRVPGGGDWSNTTIDVTDEDPITLQYTTTEVRDA